MKKTNEDRNQIDPSFWFNYWHGHDWDYQDDTYPDMTGHIQELESIFVYAKLQSEHISTDFQLWILLDPDDPLQDAVYLHTPNPHSDFPHDFSDVKWVDDVPIIYQPLANNRRFGRRTYKGQETYVIMESNN